jgi:hypothetical protein
VTTPAQMAERTDRLRVDFLFLDLEICTRCRGTDQSLESALEVVRKVLAGRGTEVEVNKIHVESAAQARELRFASSPTIRVNGRDVALELRESSCSSEACTDGCGESIACRVWVHEGREHTEPPVAMIVDVILRAVYGGAAVEPEHDTDLHGLPDNLERFFAGEPGSRATAGSEETGCCSPAEQRTCCEPEDKAECCGTATGGSCGCR